MKGQQHLMLVYDICSQSATRWTRCTSRGCRNRSTLSGIFSCRSSVFAATYNTTVLRTTLLVKPHSAADKCVPSALATDYRCTASLCPYSCHRNINKKLSCCYDNRLLPQFNFLKHQGHPVLLSI